MTAPMDRRTFLRRAAVLAAGVVAVDQLELLERLTWEPRRLWTGWSPYNTNPPGMVDIETEISAVFKQIYQEAIFALPDLVPLQQLRGPTKRFRARPAVYFQVVSR